MSKNQIGVKFSQMEFNNKPPSTKQSGVYKIKCDSCHKAYIGEMARDLFIRVKEHSDDLKFERNKPESGIVNHNKETGHSFEFENTRIVFPRKNKKKSKLLNYP